MSRLPDYYAILGVHPLADEEVIAAAYRALAKKYHPDTAGAGSAARFVEVQEAYEVLRDPERRSAYDRSRQSEAARDTSQVEGPNDGPTAATDGEVGSPGAVADAPADPSPQRFAEHKSRVGMALTLGFLVIAATVLIVEVAKDRAEKEAAVTSPLALNEAPKGSLVEPEATEKVDISSGSVTPKEIQIPPQANTEQPVPEQGKGSGTQKEITDRIIRDTVEEADASAQPGSSTREEFWFAPDAPAVSKQTYDRVVGETATGGTASPNVHQEPAREGKENLQW